MKAARFVRFCDAFNIPLVTFVDVPGFLPGIDQEHGGIILHGAKLLYAFAEATVPKITDHYAKSLRRRVRRHGEQTHSCGRQLGVADGRDRGDGRRRARSRRFSAARSPTAKDKEAKMRELIDEYTERFANPYIAAQRGYVDDVIEASKTRSAITNALEMLRKEARRPAASVSTATFPYN